MPTQARGFFSCDFCSAILDTLEESTEHEANCPKRPPQTHRPPGTQFYPPRFYPGGNPYGNMAPLSSAELERYGHPQGTPHHGPMKLRALPLMGPDRSGSIAPEDGVVCQSLELFEASPEVAADFDGSRSGGTPVVPKQVGVRCAHCATSPAASSDYSCLFPGSLGAVSAIVRQIAENHLTTCRMVPHEIRDACKTYAKRRHEAANQEGRNAADEDERSRMALLDYCVGVCQHFGIINKQPHKTGIAFADSEMPGSGFPQTPGETPAGLRGPPSGPYSGERTGPPMSYDHRMGYPPPMRPGMPPMMGGPGDAIAPTPLQRRREPPMYSVDRSEGGQTSSGYPTPFSQGHHGEGGYGHDMQTPQQPNFDGKDGPTPRSAPPSGHPSDSPPGYSNHYDLPSNFPYYMESDRTWHCKFCSHIHPSYREPHSIWSSANGGPPSGSFIDSHLSMCRSYHQSIPSPPGYQHGPPPPYGMPPPYMASYPPPPPGWEGGQHSPSGPSMPPPPHAGYPPQSRPPPDHQYPYAPHPADEFGARVMLGAAPPPPPPRKPDGETIRNAIDHLTNRETEYYERTPSASKADRLVLDEDKLLLTDYFYFLMKQLRLCRFSESDRKTRGGKREKIKIGYGGLQCIHCADIPNSRKFFWSNVDRLANSFAEIPGHVLKCRRCPMQTKEALLQLKQFHPEQMARLPRGSQKVFFRRMWRRLHDDDDDDGTAEASSGQGAGSEDVKAEGAEEDKEKEATPKKESPASKADKEKSPDSVSEESTVLLQRSTLEAAKILADAVPAGQPNSLSSHVLLAIPEDKEWLSDSDCFIRKQLEVFCATEADVATAQADKKYPVHVGQVGIRCIHCSLAKDMHGASGTAVAFPFAVTGIYEAVREFQRLHLDSCDNLPEATKDKLAAFKGASSLSSVLRKYYVLAAKALGIHDTREGIRAGGEAAPLGSQAAFSFAEGDVSLVPVQSTTDAAEANNTKKRQTDQSSEAAEEEPPAKKVKEETAEEEVKETSTEDSENESQAEQKA